MASAAEQLAANVNWSAFGKAEELKKRIWFTLGAVIVYRLGAYIPLPGVNSVAFEQSFLAQRQGALDVFNMFSGGAVQRMSVFALSVVPYISAAILIQLLGLVVPQLAETKDGGALRRKAISQYKRYLTVILAMIQAYGVAIALEGRAGIVADPGALFRISTVVGLTGGATLLFWLVEQIASRGLGNGWSLILFAGIVAQLPHAFVQLFELGRQGSVSTVVVLGVLVMVVAIVAFIVFMERAHRRVPITYPRRQVGNKVYEGQSSFLPLKLNTAGILSPVVAASLVLLPTTVTNLSSPIYLALYAVLIVFFAFFYTWNVFNSVETAETLKKNGGFIPGVRPGERTAQYIDQILTRISALGAAYLTLVCLLPEWLISYSGLPPYFGGTAILIVISVTMDTIGQIHGYLQAQQYEGLINRTKSRGRKK